MLKKLVLVVLIINVSISSAWAGIISVKTGKDKTISLYGVNSKVSTDGDTSNGVGFKLDSEFLKFKSEFTPDFYNLATVVKFNPFKQFYIKTGASFVDQKLVALDNASERIQQYSGALAAGYQLKNDIYFEIGGSYTQLDGKPIGTGFFIDDETTKRAYVEGVKRWEIKNFTIDTSVNVGKFIPELGTNTTSYGMGVDLYPNFIAGSKIGYSFQYEDNNVLHGIEAQYGYLAASYKRNTSQDTYQATLGLKIAFDNLFDAKSYGKPSGIIPHISELHAFESIVLDANTKIQSSQGVQANAKTETDTTQDAFSFEDQTVSATGSSTTSNSITVAGFDSPAIISISDPDNRDGAYSINGEDFTAVTGTVENGDTVRVQLRSGGDEGTIEERTKSVTLTIGGVSDTFSVTTLEEIDTTPVQFTFIDQENVTPDVLGAVFSNRITVSGLSDGATTTISIIDQDAQAAYQINNGNFVSTEGTVENGDTVRLVTILGVLPASFVTLDIGGQTDTFEVSTTEKDTTPDPFTFIDQINTGLPAGTEVQSNTIEVSGLSDGVTTTISIFETNVQGVYSINGTFFDEPSTVENGDLIAVKIELQATFTSFITIDIGGVKGSFRGSSTD